MTILVTGASGFVGSSLCQSLLKDGQNVRAAYRFIRPKIYSNEFVQIGEIDGNTNWSNALQGVNQVVHLAAKVHVMNPHRRRSLDFFKVNVEGTARLALQAHREGVKRFIFISSVKVNGEVTALGTPFCAEDRTDASDAYAASKAEAETTLRQISFETGMELVIIRPPLIYGQGVKANFYKMIKWLSMARPLPLASVTENRRSFVSLGNLVDLIMICAIHPLAANQTFMVSDDNDLSTVDLLTRIGFFLRKPARLFHVRPRLLEVVATLAGKEAVYQRLCGTLQVDIRKTKNLLNWRPPVTVDEGLKKAIQSIEI
jgi:nucleoside-diphosphate-sugar epimerase